MKCNIREYVVRRYGEKMACRNSTLSWDECESKCKMASNCPMCGHRRILVDFRLQICVNPDCVMEKWQTNKKV